MRLRIDDNVLVALGISREKLAKMTMSKLCDLIWEKGYQIECVNCRPSPDPHCHVQFNPSPPDQGQG